MRVLLEPDAELAETTSKARNRYRAAGNPSPDQPVDDLRNTRSKRDNRQHKPRRTSTAFSRNRPIGPYSRLPAIAELDGRRKEAMLMSRVREELTEHVGGNPSVTEKLLIERAVMLSLRCAQIDIKIMAGEVLTLHDQTHSLAWYNGLRRCLVDLGLQARAPGTKETDLGDWIVRQNSKELVP